MCYLRLDFESFDINGLSDSIEQKDTDPKKLTECQDKFMITVSTLMVLDICIPTIAVTIRTIVSFT